jgi:hypothetical protein
VTTVTLGVRAKALKMARKSFLTVEHQSADFLGSDRMVDFPLAELNGVFHHQARAGVASSIEIGKR